MKIKPFKLQFIDGLKLTHYMVIGELKRNFWNELLENLKAQ